MRRVPTLATLFGVLFAAAGWAVGTRRLTDNSFMWHLVAGHRILDHGIPRADPFSFTAPGAHWVAQSWLAEALYAVVDDLAGGFGLRILVAVSGAALGTLLYGLALHLARDRIRAAGITFLAILPVFVVFSERPLTFGLVALAVLLWVVEVPDSWVGRRPELVLPILLWLWANVHGSFALGLAYLGLHVLGRWIEGDLPWAGRSRRIAIGTAIGVGIILVNPYGLGLLLFPVQLVTNGEALRGVAEWMSPDFRTANGMVYAAWLVMALLALSRGRRASWRDLVVAVPFLLLGLWAIRNIGVAAMVTLPIVARAVSADAPRPEQVSRVNVAFAVALAMVPVLFTVQAVAEPDYDFTGYPVAAFDTLVEEGRVGQRLYTKDAWAGYSIWRFGTQQPVFMDDRFDMYPLQVQRDYVAIATLDPGWSERLDHYGVEAVVVPKASPLGQALALSPGWRRLSLDDVAVTYVRAA